MHWLIRVVMMVVASASILIVERFVLAPPRVPLPWEYWLFFVLLAYFIQMWINDLLAWRNIGAVRAYQLAYPEDNTGKQVPIISRLTIIYPFCIFVTAYGIWYLQNFPVPVFHSPPA
jgi:hypothetical protein